MVQLYYGYGESPRFEDHISKAIASINDNCTVQPQLFVTHDEIDNCSFYQFLGSLLASSDKFGRVENGNDIKLYN